MTRQFLPVPRGSFNNRKFCILLTVIFVGISFYLLGNFASKDIYELSSFCDAGGTCHEKPDKPSPRTVYSAYSKEQFDLWWKVHEELNATAQRYALRREAQSRSEAQSRPFILAGDSITESWIGTNMGKRVDRAKGVAGVLQEVLATSSDLKLDPLVLAIAGDQTQHLLYRLQNGQLLPAYAEDPTSIFVVLIGTNNIGSGELPGPVAQGIKAVADYILANTKGSLLLLQNLPRGDTFRLERICPPRCNDIGEPFRSFLPAIEQLNKAMDGEGLGLAEKYGSDRFLLVDCGLPFRAEGDEVIKSLMPDLLHPNAAGHRILGHCIVNHANKLAKLHPLI